MTQERHVWKFWKIRRFGRRTKVQRNVKDRLFRFLFEKDREALLELYNALNGTNYKDSSKLEIVTIESAVYVVMKNDLAFVLAGTLNMYEHQSTYSPNLPVRFLIYLAQEYQTVIERAEKSLYGAGLISLPTPKCVVFYNGTNEMPEERTLRLSDAFEDKEAKADVELAVRMLNINHGHNRLLMEKCRVLKEYAEFVDITRKFMLEEKHMETALAAAVDYCIEKGILEMFLRKNRAEVLGMLLEEFDVKKYERTLRSEGLEEGIKLGRKQGIEQGIRCMVEALQEAGQTKAYITDKVAEKYALSKAAAEKKLISYWK
ncbi:MAG: hypothetical protein K2M20_07325 [Lachnospiraceae bacterium]|nr:hypothetical protein [Lachnospiraceae bacterium]